MPDPEHAATNARRCSARGDRMVSVPVLVSARFRRGHAFVIELTNVQEYIVSHCSRRCLASPRSNNMGRDVAAVDVSADPSKLAAYVSRACTIGKRALANNNANFGGDMWRPRRAPDGPGIGRSRRGRIANVVGQPGARPRFMYATWRASTWPAAPLWAVTRTVGEKQYPLR